jgi:hypothetical protein
MKTEQSSSQKLGRFVVSGQWSVVSCQLPTANN